MENLFNRIVVILFSTLVFLSFPALVAQEVQAQIDLDDGIGASDYAFGMRLTPDGQTLYVAIPGYFGDENNRIVAIDTDLDGIVDEGTTGLYPEEVELLLDGSGGIERIFVSNSTDGTVSVLHPDLTTDTVIDLTQGGATTYPFGLVMGPDDRYLYVSTVNAGEIYVVDTDPGPTYMQVVATHYMGDFNGRMACYEGRLLVPGSDMALGAVLHVLELGNPGNLVTVILDGDTSAWPGANDLVVTSDGFAYVPVVDYGFPKSALLYEVDLNLSMPAVSRTIDLSEVGPDIGLEHGIAASSDGNTLVVTYLDDSIVKFVGRKAGCAIGYLDVDPFHPSQLCEAVFSLDDEKVYVSSQVGNAAVFVLSGVPKHGLSLEGTVETTPGGQVEMRLAGGEEGEYGLFILSPNQGTVLFPTFQLDIAAPHSYPYFGIFGPDHRLVMPTLNVPGKPSLSGKTFYFQGLTQDGDFEYRPSNLRAISIL